MTARIADYFIARIAGLPFDTLAGLRCERVLGSLRELEQLERELVDRRDADCDALYNLISTQEDSVVRQRLIGLKRCLYNLRVPPHDLSLYALAPLIQNEALSERLADFERGIRRLNALTEDGPKALAADLDDARRQLRKLWSEDPLAAGLLLSNPSLHDMLDEYLDQAGPPTTKKFRHLEDTLLAYLYRATTKTSPFATFTLLSSGRLSDDTVSTLEQGGPLRPVVRVTLKSSIVVRLMDRLTTASAFSPYVPLRLNPTRVAEDGGLLFIRRSMPAEDDEILRATESFEWLRCSAAVGLLLEELARASVPPTRGQLAAALAARLGDGIGEEQLLRFIDGVVACGLLQSSLETATGDPAVLERLPQILADADSTVKCEFLRQASRTSESVRALASATRATRPRLWRDTATAATQLLKQVGASVNERDLIHLDAYCDEDIVVRRADIDGVLRSLARFAEVLPAFDAGSVTRDLLHAFYIERYGTGDGPASLTEFLRDFYRDGYAKALDRADDTVWNPYLAQADASLPSRAHELATLRMQFIDDIIGMIGERSANSSPVELDGSWLAQFGERCRPYGARLVRSSVGFLGQLQRSDRAADSPGFVVNQLISGFGAYFARYADARTFGLRGAALAERLVRQYQAELGPYEPVEIVANFGLNLQVHQPLTRRCLLYPGEDVPWNDVEVIDWSTIKVSYDGESDSIVLTSKVDGRRILPIRTGAVSPHLMPTVYRVLASLGPNCVPDLSLLDLIEHRLGSVDSEQVRGYPRITHGDVVLMRRTWRIGRAQRPILPPRTSEFQRMRALRRWARELDLPRRVFVVTMEMADFFRADARPENLRRLYKPFYVDFDDPLSCRLFQRFTMRADSTLTIREMLPSPEQLIFGRSGHHHVSELLLECYS